MLLAKLMPLELLLELRLMELRLMGLLVVMPLRLIKII